MPDDVGGQHRFAVALADTLIPGEGAFPSASLAGAVDKFEKRLKELRGERHIGKIRGLLSVGDAFEQMTDDMRTAALAKLEHDQHPMFEEFLAVLYFSYYESPLVTAAIQGLGLAYHNPPQPHGYKMSPFDEAEPSENPRHGRGHYVRTEEVRRVSFAGLDHLADPIQHP